MSNQEGLLDKQYELIYSELPKTIHGILVDTAYVSGYDKELIDLMANTMAKRIEAEIKFISEMLKNYDLPKWSDITFTAILLKMSRANEPTFLALALVSSHMLSSLIFDKNWCPVGSIS